MNPVLSAMNEDAQLKMWYQIWDHNIYKPEGTGCQGANGSIEELEIFQGVKSTESRRKRFQQQRSSKVRSNGGLPVLKHDDGSCEECG